MDEFEQGRIRQAVLERLADQDPDGNRVFRREELANFLLDERDGYRFPVIDPQRGIRVPRGWDAALSILTTYTAPGGRRPYEDSIGPDGFLRYNYRGDNPEHPDNRGLREAMRQALPLVWFVGVAPGSYIAIHPVWIVAEERRDRRFIVAVDQGQVLLASSSPEDPDRRWYAERLTRQRLHQPVFRARVLMAYEHRCAVCGLGIPTLVDAAHILPDGHPRGTPELPNGLALCKLHHAAFDGQLLGIRPDYVVEIRKDVRDMVDGPVLVHGLQATHGRRLSVPAARSARPDPERLEERYETFLRRIG
jgi:putative restriction endonuclease